MHIYHMIYGFHYVDNINSASGEGCGGFLSLTGRNESYAPEKRKDNPYHHKAY